MSETTPDLALSAESAAFLGQLEQLYELEQRKRAVGPSDPLFQVIATQVEDAVRLLLDRAERQVALGTDPETVTPIREVPADATAEQVLRQWREVERQLAERDRDSASIRDLRLQADALRRAYQELYRRKTAEDD